MEYREEHRRYEVVVNNFSHYEFAQLKETLKVRFRQITIYMTKTPTDRL